MIKDQSKMKKMLTKAAVAALAVLTMVLTGCENDLPAPNDPEIPEIPEKPDNGGEEPTPKPAQAIIKATYNVEAGNNVLNLTK